MGFAAKIDPKELKALVDAGKRNKEIAEHFGVTSGAVSQAVKRLQVALAATAATQMIAPPTRKTPVSLQAAGGLVKKRNKAMEILAELANKVNDELTWIETNIPQTQDSEYRAWLEQKLKYMAEVRKVVSAMADVGTKLYQINVVEQALVVMLEEIGCESADLQKRIRDRLARSCIYLPILG